MAKEANAKRSRDGERVMRTIVLRDGGTRDETSVSPFFLFFGGRCSSSDDNLVDEAGIYTCINDELRQLK